MHYPIEQKDAREARPATVHDRAGIKLDHGASYDDMMPFNYIIFMKYGVHAGEGVQSIVARKLLEVERCGFAFWGYGGVLCHPITQVKPLLDAAQSNGSQAMLVMSETQSRWLGEALQQRRYSQDGAEWMPLPDGVSVVGSRYALKIQDLEVCSFDLDPSRYVVAAGQSAGRLLSSYVRGRVDKACGVLDKSAGADCQRVPWHITLCARVVDAVFVR